MAFLRLLFITCHLGQALAFLPSINSRPRTMHEPSQLQATSNQASATATTLLSLTLLAAPLLAPLSTVAHAAATDQGASSLSNSKIATGGASTLQSGRESTKTTTIMIIRRPNKYICQMFQVPFPSLEASTLTTAISAIGI